MIPPLTFCSFGATLAAQTLVESVISTPPNVLPQQNGRPQALQGGAAQRVLSGRLRRSGYSNGAWMFDAFDNGGDELNTLLLALYGGYSVSSKSLYVITPDERGFWSPFLCNVDCPYVGTSANTFNEQPFAVRFDLIGGILQTASKSADYSRGTGDRLTLNDTTAGNITDTLPAVAGVTPYTIYSAVKTAAAHNLVLDPNGSELINGASTLTLTAQNARVDIYSDGVSWQIAKSGLWAV